jgi:hypothetical protein
MGGVLAFFVVISYFFRESGDAFLEILVDLYCPGFAIFLIWAMPFDMWLAKALSTKFTDTDEQRYAYRQILSFDLVLWLLLVATWGNMFFQLAYERVS